MTDAELLEVLKSRVKNPAISDSEFVEYLSIGKVEIAGDNYSSVDVYDAQLLDSACLLLSIDNKFPEISSINQNGISTSFAANDPERYRRRIASRRFAAWVD